MPVTPLRSWRKTHLLVLAVILLPAAAPAQARVWRSRSAGYEVTWSASDISARRLRDGAGVFSARAIADREWAAMQADHDEEVPVREWEQRYRVLSLVGGVLSLEEATYCDCGGAHPISWTRFVAYDLARSTLAHPQLAVITRLVDEASLVRALAADALLRQAMDSAGVRGFTRVSEVAALRSQTVQPPSGECTFAVGEDFPSNFALHHLDGGRVAVRFSLSHSVEVCRGMMIQLGVLATPLPGIREALTAAAARRAGVLMKDGRSVGPGRTVLRYHPEMAKPGEPPAP
jgi:hypothetical protein